MNTTENIIEPTNQSYSDSSTESEKEKIQSRDCIQPYALSLVGMDASVKSIDDSTRQIKTLIESLDTQKNPKNHELIIRGLKETREFIKLKLELGKFAHVVGGNITKKQTKETA